MMTKTFWTRPIGGLLALALVTGAAPVLSQQTAKSQPAGAKSGTAQPASSQADAEARLRKLEAEVKALQRQVFPGSNGKVFTPEIDQGTSTAAPAGTPATSAVTDLLTRMDSVEAQLSRLTAQGEENANRVAQLEARLAAMSAAGAPAAGASAPTSSTLPAASGPAASGPAVQGPMPDGQAVSGAAPVASSAVAAQPAPAPAVVTPPPAAVTPPPAPVPAPAPVVEKPKVASAAAIKPAAAKPATAPTAAKPAPPSAQRVAAVKAIEKPVTKDPADDEYSYGFRLWEAKFYPEAQQQLQLYISKYPNHARISWGRNLLGRAYLDDGKPREAAQWFLNNYKADQDSARAPDSLLFLAEAMRQLKDTKRACIALGEFSDGFPGEASGRLKSSYEGIRASLKCP